MKEWILERALETDSHQECIGLLELILLGLLLVVVVMEEVEEEFELEMMNSCYGSVAQLHFAVTN
ncbi:hypothetical protein L195_g009925 [Trifolium pratense]|uniref:Uncharacterized protein n=1 Tax=Trifolium pratense TaxID=57577 RepID=A0A2K3PDD9_TRIPR|nr:hypothetical protein L195_g009925 [Trifolium pratense]